MNIYRLIRTLLFLLIVVQHLRQPCMGEDQRESVSDFALKDGDRVVFVGDSITAARDYPNIIELYTLMRFPNRKIEFFNAGKGGDTATTCISRLQRDVFDRNATVVTVALGVNDIGWGVYADEKHKQAYLTGIKTIMEQCMAKGIRVYLCSPAITNEEPDRAENGFLQKMCDEGLALAKSMGARTIDVMREMRVIQRRILAANEKQSDPAKHTRLHVADGVHLNSLGQLAMGFAILKGLGAPAEVSSATINASNSKVITQNHCQVTDVAISGDIVTFNRLDEGYPLNRGIFTGLDHFWVPIPNEINRYLLTVSDLPPGRYELKVNGRLVGKLRSQDLARGVNLSSMTGDPWEPGGPWDTQSIVVKELVDARDRLAVSQLFQSAFGDNHPRRQELVSQAVSLNDELVRLQRLSAKPIPLNYVLRRLQEE